MLPFTHLSFTFSLHSQLKTPHPINTNNKNEKVQKVWNVKLSDVAMVFSMWPKLQAFEIQDCTNLPVHDKNKPKWEDKTVNGSFKSRSVMIKFNGSSMKMYFSRQADRFL